MAKSDRSVVLPSVYTAKSADELPLNGDEDEVYLTQGGFLDRRNFVRFDE
jgi:hypothetical protein